MRIQDKFSFSGRTLIILLLFMLNNVSYAQSYKYWFMNQGDINKSLTAVGYADNSTLSDTSVIKTAFKNAVLQLVEQKNVEVKFVISHLTGGSAGTAQMDYNYDQNIDTSLVENVMAAAKIIDTMVLPQYSAVLISTESNDIDLFYCTLYNIKQMPVPDWINNIPQDENYFYAIGTAPKYYYEVSSWRTAESEAIKNMAAQINSTIKSVIKSEESIEEVKVQYTYSKMQEVEIMNRWFDSKNQIYYVLARVSKNNVSLQK